MSAEDPTPYDPFRREFPTLPIITPDRDDERLSNFQKYGGLYPLGIAGLVTLVALIGWFAWGVWSLQAVWWNVYVLHDESRGEADRISAAYALSRSPDVNQRQLWDIALRKPLPPLARYLVAEGLTAEAVAADPNAYGAAVARSEGWPDWLRLILARPLAYTAAIGRPVPREPLEELAAGTDPAVALLARFALASSVAGDPASDRIVREAAVTEGPLKPLAGDLVGALDARMLDEKLLALDSATLRLRSLPPAAALWERWEVRGDKVVPR